MKKIGGVLLIIFLLLISISIVSAANDTETEKIDKAYNCLKEKVEGNCDTIGLDAQSFSLLAIGECKSELEDKSYNDNTCWPSGSCKLKDTALAVWALDRAGGDTEDAESWLLSQKKVPEDLIWYLEIDADEKTDCKISYGSTEKTITIDEDKKINKDAGSCLSRAQDNYWLKIDDGCYDKNFTISCDQSFISTLIYEKKQGGTIYVSSQTESASADGKTEHTVNSYCFSTSSDCDYEGSLWTTFALSQTGNDISGFLPYLIAMADEDANQKYLPSAFLFMITDYGEYATTLANEQKTEGYWQTSDSNSRYYDTALALLSLYSINTEQADNAKTWLFDVQEDNGCWRNNIADTAFILYALSPRAIAKGGGGDTEDCEDYKKYCESPIDCSQDNVLDSYSCYGGKVCCSVSSGEKTCEDRNGVVCSENQQCTGATVEASDSTKCCSGSCITQEENECENQNYDCRTSCLDDEEERAYTCIGGDVCCGAKTKPSYWWIWLLVILIILLVLAIIFRNQLKIWFFRIKNKFKRGPAPTRVGPGPRFPPAPPGALRGRIMPRMILPWQAQQGQQGRPRPVARPASKTDKELEETLRKLKEMAK